MITPAQSRAARGLLRWTIPDLAKASGVSLSTIGGFELERTNPNRATLAVIQNAFEAAGVDFIDANGGGPGLRLRG